MEKVFHLGLCIDDLKGAKLAIVQAIQIVQHVFHSS